MLVRMRTGMCPVRASALRRVKTCYSIAPREMQVEEYQQGLPWRESFRLRCRGRPEAIVEYLLSLPRDHPCRVLR